MKRLLLVIVLSLVMTVPNALGQIKMNSDGRVAVGTTTLSNAVLKVVSDDPVGMYVTTEGSGNIRRGVNSVTTGGNSSTGLYGVGQDAALVNFGVLATGDGGNTSYGIYAHGKNATTNYAGYFSGDLAYTGNLYDVSDIQFKENVAVLSGTGILSRLLQLSPRSYTFKATYDFMGLPSGKQFGLIAQEVEAVFPELVRNQVHPGPVDEEGRETGEPVTYKGVDYVEMIPLLIQALKEQQAQIDALKSALEANGITVGEAGQN